MAKKAKWYTALINFSTKEIVRPMEWEDKDEAAHQDMLNEIDAAMNHAGHGSTSGGRPIPAGDDWQAYGPDEKPFSFEEIVETS
jgi:hypothetical protein